MACFIRSWLLGALVLALGIGTAGCSGGTDTPPKEKTPDAKKGMEEMMKSKADRIEKAKKEMADKQSKGDAGGDQTEKDKDKDKKKESDKEEPRAKDKKE